jgi:hypothetical protein
MVANYCSQMKRVWDEEELPRSWVLVNSFYLGLKNAAG